MALLASSSAAAADLTAGGAAQLSLSSTECTTQEQLQVVQDPKSDVVQASHLEKMEVGVPGRAKFQRIYVKLENDKLPKVPYDAKTDAPSQPISVLPTTEENEGRAGTRRFLVVGLVLADTPAKYDPTGSRKARDRQRDEDRKSRGTMSANRNVLRAIVPETDFVKTSSIKYYVAVNQIEGICNARTITEGCIFFFAEFWEGVSGEVRVRRTQLSAACKHHAAINKTLAAAPTRKIRDNSTASSSLSVTKRTNPANLLLLHYSLWAISKSQKSFDMFIKTATDLLPVLVKMPSDEGTLAFYDLDAPMSPEDAEKLIEDVSYHCPSICKLDSKLILSLHEGLRNCQDEEVLPYSSLVPFLEFGHDRAVPGWEQHHINAAVLEILKTIKILNKTIPSPVWGLSASDKEGAMMTVITTLRESLMEVQTFLKESAQEMRNQHGGLDRHITLEDLMTKIRNVMDKIPFMSWEEKVAAVHVHQLALSNENGADMLGDVIAIMGELVSLE